MKIPCLLLIAILLNPASAEEFESPPVLQAADVLKPEALEGEHYRIAPQVANDGYLNTYTLDTNYGSLEAYGTAMLALRAKEAAALAQLDELSKSEVFLKAVADSAIGQLETIGNVARHPIATVKGVPRGIGRLFRSTRREVDQGLEAASELVKDDENGDDGGVGDKVKHELDVSKQAKRYLGVDDGIRRWAEKLGVDPYTSNELLRAALEEVAEVDATARFGMRFVGVPAIPGISVIEQTNDAVWGMDSFALFERNQKLLEGLGADDESIENLLENEHFGPYLQTLLVDALASMDGVADRAGVLRSANGVESREEAMFFTNSIALLARLHHEGRVFERLIATTGLPFGIGEHGELSFAAAVDHLVWTEAVARVAGQRLEAIEAEPSEVRDVYFLGTTSERCRRELEARGWSVHDKLMATSTQNASE